MGKLRRERIELVYSDRSQVLLEQTNNFRACPGLLIKFFLKKAIDSIFPIPHLLEEKFHVDFLTMHLDHPGVLKHAPRGCATGGFSFQTAHWRDN